MAFRSGLFSSDLKVRGGRFARQYPNLGIYTYSPISVAYDTGVLVTLGSASYIEGTARARELPRGLPPCQCNLQTVTIILRAHLDDRIARHS